MIGLLFTFLWTGGALAAVPGLVDGVVVVAPIPTPVTASDHAFNLAVSDDGRWVVFHSRAGDLVAGDGNGLDDVFLLDRETRRYTRVSAAMGGGDPNGASNAPAISADGRIIAFQSAADNLVPDDLNGRADVFVYQRANGTIERVSLSSSGAEGNANSRHPALSFDGRYVAFASDADNLVAGDLNSVTDIFVRDRSSGQTMRVSVASDGTEGDAVSLLPSLSANGRYVAFHSEATNFSDNEFDVLADIFLHDRVTGGTELVNVSTRGVRSNSDSAAAAVSADGRHVTFYSRATTLEPGLENIHFDIFVRDTLSARTDLISRALDDEPSNGASFNPALSAAGRFVAFQSLASNLVGGDSNAASDVFRYDRETATLVLISANGAGGVADAGSFTPALTGDGREVLFESQAGDLDGLGGGQTALFANHDGEPGSTRLSLAADLAVLPNAPVDALALSAGGRFVLFSSAASNLADDDFNGNRDVFVFDRHRAAVELISGDPPGVPVNGPGAGDSDIGSVSANGCVVAFISEVDGDALGSGVPLDDNGASDVFLRDRCNANALTVVSLALDGVHHADAASTQIALSSDGSQAAFTSLASDLTPAGNAPAVTQVYLADFVAGTVTLISAVAGAPGAAASDSPAISADGEFVAFVGRDPALDPTVPVAERPAPGNAAVYRYHVADGLIELISRGLDAGGGPASPLGESDQPTISGDGSVIAFTSNATNLTIAGSGGLRQVYAWREAGAEPNRIVALEPPGGPATGASEHAVVSADGRVVVFASDAPEFAADDTNGQTDVIAYDLSDGGAALISRVEDGTVAGGGASELPAVAGQGARLIAGFVSSAALVDASAVARGLYLQSFAVPLPALTIDGFVDSPLQSVERGALRLQVRNTGNVPLGAGDAITLTFPLLGHPVMVGDPPRWQCTHGGFLSCEFVGDATLGDTIPPTAAERLDFEFDMFPGADPVLSQVRLAAGFLGPGAQPVLDLATERVVRGVVWSATVDAELGGGELGEFAVTVTNGGQEAVGAIRIEVRPLEAGGPEHPRGPPAGTDWQCADVPPPEEPESRPVLWACDYQGPALPPGSMTMLSVPFGLAGGTRRRASIVELKADVDVVSPDPFEVLVTEVAGLVFQNGFEG